jgi:acyl-CoA synthetase (AMP-forming)/AMP-acid ligase II
VIDRVNLGDLLAREAPDHPAVIDARDPASPRTWSTGELDAVANGVARGLLREGLRPGDRVAILSANRAEFLAAYLGTMRAGMVTVPINFRLPAETVRFIFADAEVKRVFVDAERRPMVPSDVAVTELDGTGPQRFDRLVDRGPFRTTEPGPGSIAKILYTSGSTGRPKGVPLPHTGQLWAVAKYYQGPAQGRLDRTLVVAPTYHKNGLFFSMMALSNQMTIVSLPRFEPRGYLEAVDRYRCTVLTGIPTMFALIARERDLVEVLDLSAVRLVTIGSAPLTEALVDRVKAIFPRAEVTNGYGTTEAGPCAFGPHPEGLPRPPLSLGYPFADIEWRLVDGVLELKTPALMPGYLNLPKATAERIKNGWYSTGDLMRHDENGFFFFVGRADDMFVCGGENVYPGEVEKLLERHPSVAQASVVPVPDEIKGQIPIAFVVPVRGVALDPEEVKRFALANGPAYAHPRLVIPVEEIPVAGTHKVDRRILIERATGLVRATGRQ